MVVDLSDATPEAVERASAELWRAGACAIQEAEGEALHTVTLLASFPTGEAARSVAASLSIGEVGVRVGVQEVTDTGWQEAWRDFIGPTPAGRNLLIAPAWRPVPVGTGRTVIEIDPGQAFGSGTHASTRLALALLEECLGGGERVLDVGCGSGILAVAAARLGAATVTALDVDAHALEMTAANAARNGVDQLVSVTDRPLAQVAGRFDLVVANVTAATQAELAVLLTERVAPGGYLLLAGLLPGQWDHLAGLYDGLAIRQTPSLDGWTGALLQRPAPA